MTDTELLLKKIAFIESCVHDLEEMARLDRFEPDVREQRFILHTLQLALQATIAPATECLHLQGLNSGLNQGGVRR